MKKSKTSVAVIIVATFGIFALLCVGEAGALGWLIGCVLATLFGVFEE